jgi:hypothetical protein
MEVYLALTGGSLVWPATIQGRIRGVVQAVLAGYFVFD